jgi:hypothetical protein
MPKLTDEERAKLTALRDLVRDQMQFAALAHELRDKLHGYHMLHDEDDPQVADLLRRFDAFVAKFKP